MIQGIEDILTKTHPSNENRLSARDSRVATARHPRMLCDASRAIASVVSTHDDHLYDLSVVIVSFNTRNALRESLQSVDREVKDLKSEIFVVDNGSVDGSPEMVEHEFPHVRLIRSAENLGFGAANNLAIEASRGCYVVLLNSDAFLCPGSLLTAVRNMEASPQVALAGGKLTGRDLSWQPSARMFPHVVTDAFVITGLAAKFPGSPIFGRFDRTWADPAEPSEVDWVPGAFSVIRAKVLREIGLFDPRFFLYSEEVDLCRRIKQAGYQIWYWPEIQVIHVGGESSRRLKGLDFSSADGQVTRWRMRSTLLYYRKHHGAMAWLVKWLELAMCGLSTLRNQFREEPRRTLKREANQNLAACMRLAWKETQGGRVSPPRPW
jgi:GT2 family glycosyltransferase